MNERWTALALVAIACLAPFPAHAQAELDGRVLFAADQGVDDDRSTALRAELGLRALELDLVPALAGESDAARERHARLLAERRGAYATLWVDDARQEARAVTPAGAMHRATLPRSASTIDARVLAVLLASLLDEALAPPGRDEPAGAPSVAAAAPDPATVVVVVPSEPSVAAESPALVPADPHDTRDGDVHPYAIVDFSVGAVWSPGQQSNIAGLVQLVGAGLLVDRLRAEVVLGMGIDQAMDGRYDRAFTVVAQAFVGTSIPTGLAALDLGGVLGYVGHEFIDAHTLSTSGMMSAVRIGGAVGLSMRDSLAIFPFRARIEFGAFARPSPGHLAPFTNVVLGIAFW